VAKGVIQVHLIRHGACQDDAFLRGSTESELSKTGWEQSKSAFEGILNSVHSKQPGLVVCSPAKRCLSLVNSFALNTVEIEAAFKERDFGEWDGQSYGTLKALYPQALDAYLSEPFTFDIPRAESLGAFEQRVLIGWQNLLAKAFARDLKEVVVMTHGGVIRVLLKAILGLEDQAMFHWKIGYGAVLSLACFETDSKNCFEQCGEKSSVTDAKKHCHNAPYIQIVGLTQQVDNHA